MIRVELPGHLRALAHVKNEVAVEVVGTVSVLSVLDALEAQYPMLRGTIRDHVTRQRRPFLRFFACGKRQGATVGSRSNRGRLAVQLRFETLAISIEPE